MAFFQLLAMAKLRISAGVGLRAAGRPSGGEPLPSAPCSAHCAPASPGGTSAVTRFRCFRRMCKAREDTVEKAFVHKLQQKGRSSSSPRL